MLDVRPYRQPADSAAIYALWQAVLGRQWPIAAADFHRLLTGSPQYQAGDYFVACQDDQIVGFVAAQIDRSDPASAAIAALFVDPQLQRRGIGTALHAAALGDTIAGVASVAGFTPMRTDTPDKAMAKST